MLNKQYLHSRKKFFEKAEKVLAALVACNIAVFCEISIMYFSFLIMIFLRSCSVRAERKNVIRLSD